MLTKIKKKRKKYFQCILLKPILFNVMFIQLRLLSWWIKKFLEYTISPHSFIMERAYRSYFVAISGKL